MRAVLKISQTCARAAIRSEVSALPRAFSTSASSVYAHGKHRSNAEALVNKIPPIEVDGHIAVCDGGSGALGHPVEYIQLDTVSKEPAICKYCGLRYVSKHSHSH